MVGYFTIPIMKIEYYPSFDLGGEKVFLDSKSLDGICVSYEYVDVMSLRSVESIPRLESQTPAPEGTRQTLRYLKLVQKSLYGFKLE